MKPILISAVALLAACAGTDTRQPATEEQPAAVTERQADATADFTQRCPALIEGTEIDVSDTEGGVVLTFTTTGDVSDLRSRARRMAEMYQTHGGRHDMMWHRVGPGRRGMERGPGMGMGHGRMPAATATVEDIDGGARIRLVPADPAQLEQLREHARLHRDRMQSGECPMVHATGQG